MSITNLIQKSLNLGKRAFYRVEKWLYFKRLLKAEKFTFPDFLCIGVEKAGTTWLYENLKYHHELFLPARKELNYFSNEHRFYGMPLSAYADYFKNSDRIKGEITPCSNLPLRRIRFIKTIMPSLKIILILRNPIERMWSSALMHLVRAQKRSFDSIDKDEFCQIFEQPVLYTRGDYPKILQNWRKVFPVNQFHICFYDDFKNAPQEFITEVFRFLGVSTEVDWKNYPLEQRFNKSPDYEIPDNMRLHLQRIYKESIEYIQREFPEKRITWN